MKKPAPKSQAWKVWVFLLFLLLIAGASISTDWIISRHSATIGKSPDVYMTDTKTGAVRPVSEIQAEAQKPITLKPGEDKTGWTIPRGSGIQPAVRISAKFPVSFAFIPEQYKDVASPEVVRMAGRCAQQDVLRAGFVCPLDTSSQGFVLYIADNRSSGQSNEIHVDARGH